MKSIRSYLLLRLVGGAVIVLSLAGVAVYELVAHSLARQFDRNLTQRLESLASILFQHDQRLSFEFSDELMPEYAAGSTQAYFELWLSDGRLVERSESLGDGALVLPVGDAEAPSFWSAALPDGRAGRYHSLWVEVHHVYPEDGPQRPMPARVRIVVARDVEALAADQRRVLFLCAGVALALIGSIALLSWRTVERGLAPAHQLARALDELDVERLPERVEVGPLARELTPMLDKTNALLRRVAAALERERRTSADIAHELRTPISEVITTAEVALRADDAAVTHGALRTIRDVSWRMGRSVATLLRLARVESGAESFESVPLDLGELLDELVRPFETLRRERELELEVDVPSGAIVSADREALSIVLSNVLGNACHYAPHRSRVVVRFERHGERWCLSLENLAPALRAADLEALSQPFWRKDRSRSDRDRFGLGLALSRALAERNGLALRFELHESLFRVLLEGGGGAATPPEPKDSDVDESTSAGTGRGAARARARV